MKRQKIKEETRELPMWMRRGTVEVKGKVYYDESSQSWSIVRLKREIMQQMPRLKERRARFSYKMINHFTYEELIEFIQEMKKEEKPLPMLMFFYEVKKDYL